MSSSTNPKVPENAPARSRRIFRARCHKLCAFFAWLGLSCAFNLRANPSSLAAACRRPVSGGSHGCWAWVLRFEFWSVALVGCLGIATGRCGARGRLGGSLQQVAVGLGVVQASSRIAHIQPINPEHTSAHTQFLNGGESPVLLFSTSLACHRPRRFCGSGLHSCSLV